jgi:hypothetical protein
VTTTITTLETVVTTNPVVWAQAGCSPVSRGTRNSTAMIRPAATAASTDASTMCSIPSSNTTRHAPTRKKNSEPEPVPMSQQVAKTET